MNTLLYWYSGTGNSLWAARTRAVLVPRYHHPEVSLKDILAGGAGSGRS